MQMNPDNGRCLHNLAVPSAPLRLAVGTPPSRKFEYVAAASLSSLTPILAAACSSCKRRARGRPAPFRRQHAEAKSKTRRATVMVWGGFSALFCSVKV